jgi:ubiquinol-cytochrome c reductase iron-sulfur subunit
VKARRAERAVAAAFAVSALASVGLVITYLLGGETQAEGLLLGLALGGLGVGISIWAVALLPSVEVTGEREPLGSDAGAVEAVEAESAPEEVTRRTWLVRLLGAAGGTLAAALAIPSLSLGPSPGRDLFETPWSRGKRLVGADGRALRPSDLVTGSVTTVFPEGEVGSADAQTLLVKVEPDLIQAVREKADWAPDGCIAYSKICTHAGCPVGLYRAESHELLCPCHQSTFDVLRGATPTFGPADRPLPQLGLEVDDEGYLVARGDFDAPVGPGFWNVSSGGAG